MCDLGKLQLFWYELLPYVDVTSHNDDIINRTGVIYDFFKESLSECCSANSLQVNRLNHDKVLNQQMVLNKVRTTLASVGMPISLDAEFPHVPTEFVPVLETDGKYRFSPFRWLLSPFRATS